MRSCATRRASRSTASTSAGEPARTRVYLLQRVFDDAGQLGKADPSAEKRLDSYLIGRIEHTTGRAAGRERFIGEAE